MSANREELPALPAPPPPPAPERRQPQTHDLRRSNWLHGRCSSISFPGHGKFVVTCLQFDDDKIVSGSDDKTILIHDTRTGQLIRRLTGHTGGVWTMQYHENTLASGSTDRTVRIWNMETGQCTHVLEGHTSTVRCLLILPPTPASSARWNSVGSDATDYPFPVIVTGSRDSTLRVWKLPLAGRGSGGSAQGGGTVMSINPQGVAPGGGGPHIAATAAAASSESTPTNESPHLLHVLTGHTQSIRSIAGHGGVVVSGGFDSTVRVWNLVTGQMDHCLTGHRDRVYSVAYCHETRRAASGSLDTNVRVWDTMLGTALFVLEGHSSLVGRLEISPKYVLSGAADSTLRVWSSATGESLATLTGHSAPIFCLEHDPDLNLIVSGAEGGVRLWELESTEAGAAAAAASAVASASAAAARGNSSRQGGNGGFAPNDRAVGGDAGGGHNAGPADGALQAPPPPIPQDDAETTVPPTTTLPPPPRHGRFVRDITSAFSVWRVKMDRRRLVTALQRRGAQTWFEVRDFGGVGGDGEDDGDEGEYNHDFSDGHGGAGGGGGVVMMAKGDEVPLV